jgi:hypothetical protein
MAGNHRKRDTGWQVGIQRSSGIASDAVYGIRVCGDEVNEASLRGYLAWELAQLKYDGKVPLPHVMED